MTCTCRSWVRQPDIETQNGKYPMPDHHLNCGEYKLIAFARLIHDGLSCVMEQNEALEVVKDIEGPYELCNVYLTRDQFENLPEFES